MEIRRLDRANLTRAYGLDSARLLPWPVLNAPFEGAWCVLRPGDVSTAHTHHEHEIFIAMRGRSTLVVDDERHEFTEGDIAHLPPECIHQVVNDDAEDFEYYGIWWDSAMSVKFIGSLEGQRRCDRGSVASPEAELSGSLEGQRRCDRGSGASPEAEVPRSLEGQVP
nr:cupin domain-containing protein [Frankia sp. Cr1]